jgi:hypothetical protein
MIKLKNITLIAVTSVNISDTIKALEYSCKDIEFGAVKLVTHEKPDLLPDTITHEHIDKINNINEWNYQMFYNLGKFVDTDFMILIHDDGFVVNAESWRDEFLEYDYIGAPWGLPSDNHAFRDIKGDLIRVGNSVSLRSKRLIELPTKIGIEWKMFDGNHNEDSQICVHNRHIFLDHGIKFAELDVAKYFSHETEIPEINGIIPFAFHNYGHSEHINYKYRKL